MSRGTVLFPGGPPATHGGYSSERLFVHTLHHRLQLLSSTNFIQVAIKSPKGCRCLLPLDRAHHLLNQQLLDLLCRRVGLSSHIGIQIQARRQLHLDIRQRGSDSLLCWVHEGCVEGSCDHKLRCRSRPHLLCFLAGNIHRLDVPRDDTSPWEEVIGDLQRAGGLGQRPRDQLLHLLVRQPGDAAHAARLQVTRGLHCLCAHLHELQPVLKAQSAGRDQGRDFTETEPSHMADASHQVWILGLQLLQSRQRADHHRRLAV
mmetsp:Transcript_33609/g.54953  ORF Transcript_33609/g.54953 Transcript_33609/m.54953 type:complete len:260 (-) Transcript_33609:680-1459(-)